MLEKQLRDVLEFHMKVTGMPIPGDVRMLITDRLDKRVAFLHEELTEFRDATTIADQADALVDLIYVAHGGLLEMGVMPGPGFDLVHEANMKKVPGPNKRGTQYEAAKPDGWAPPDWEKHLGLEKGQYIGLRRQQVAPDLTLHNDSAFFTEPGDGKVHDKRSGRSEAIRRQVKQSLTGDGHHFVGQNPYDNSCVPRKPKILLLGYGRHGKDTVAERLSDVYGLSFTSSSQVCAEMVMLPYFEKAREEWFSLPLEESSKLIVPPTYRTAVECFADRHNHRATWFQQIEAFNTPNKANLGMAIFSAHDIYCGLRSAREFAAVKNAGLYDACIWVDRSHHVPPESRDSCTVEPWMADYVLDNNGSLEELDFNLHQLMVTINRKFNA